MSVLAVRCSETTIEIATDSQTAYGDVTVQRRTHLTDDKLWSTTDGLLVGFVGTSALGSVLRRWSTRATPDEATERGITAWVDAFHAWRRTTYEDAGSLDEMAFVVAYRGTAWIVDGYSVSGIAPDGYMATGSGMHVALGALAHGAGVATAVRIACQHVESCGLPVVHGGLVVTGAIMGDIACLDVVPISEAGEKEKVA